jgi:hypothetical protein
MSLFAVSQEWSRGLARLLGETNGRSTSRVLGDGLVSFVGGEISGEKTVKVVHRSMAAIRGGAVAFGSLWRLGQAEDSPRKSP